MRWQSEVTRRTLLSHTAAGTAALAAGAIGAYAQPASKPPNIVFILADDLGYADVSCYGRRDFATPNIDRIAARGMRFLQGYANSAVCSATRLALITGRYQYRLRLGLEEPLAGNRDVGLPPEHPTLPSLLRGRLLHASKPAAATRSVGTGRRGSSGRIRDAAARRPRGRGDRRLRAQRPAFPAQPALQRPALAVGG